MLFKSKTYFDSNQICFMGVNSRQPLETSLTDTSIASVVLNNSGLNQPYYVLCLIPMVSFLNEDLSSKFVYHYVKLYI